MRSVVMMIVLAAAIVAIAMPALLRAQTQGEMNGDACNDAAGADAQLTQTYTQVLAAHADDEVFLVKIKAAEKAWSAFRDAEIKAVYPSEDSFNGSALPMCTCTERAQLTKDRIKQLQSWLKKSEDVCAGSRG